MVGSGLEVMGIDDVCQWDIREKSKRKGMKGVQRQA